MTVAKGAQSSVATAHLTPAQLAAATNLPVQTIQRWEKRYRFPDGARSPGRHRRYADEDVARVLRVVALRDSGMGLQEAIRVVSAGDDPGAPRTQTSAERSDRIGQLRADGLEALAELDEARLWRILAEAQARFDAPEVICQLIIPLIRTTDDPTNLRRPERIQAFFFSRIVTATLSSMAARASGSSPRPGSGRTVWVACPEGEAHEVGALSAVALLAARGVDVRYLGANIPLVTLRQAALAHRPDAVVLSVTRSLVIRDRLADMGRLAEVTRVFVGGRGAWRAQAPGSPAYCLLDDLPASIDTLVAELS